MRITKGIKYYKLGKFLAKNPEALPDFSFSNRDGDIKKISTFIKEYGGTLHSLDIIQKNKQDFFNKLIQKQK